jgi:hypothetical protein
MEAPLRAEIKTLFLDVFVFFYPDVEEFQAGTFLICPKGRKVKSGR